MRKAPAPLLETEPLRPAVFRGRLNRFAVACVLREGRNRARAATAYMANPGRMGEMLLPGVELLLAPRRRGRLAWEAVGLRWRRRWPGDSPRVVFLNAARTARVAERLLEERLIPPLADATVVGREVRAGESRIDLLLSRGGAPYLLEVKSCTLVEHGLALFPDARSARARRHVETLAAAGAGGAGVLFVVQGRADRFLPDFHNDLEFARAFGAARAAIDYFPLALEPTFGADRRLRFEGRPRPLAIPWDTFEAGVADGGLYLLLLRLARARRLEAGASGPRDFPGGWYAYVGSARRGLGKRIERHLRRGKRHHWQIDALRAAADGVKALPIRGTRRGECELAAAVRAICDDSVPRFGASDCRCPGHLFRFAADPLQTAPFQQVLTLWRHRL
ncbi:MAG TPA: DNA/RNA nuclease SfsA [Planctomycetota bacterium]|jgi:sugar fermentation stimulation protein A|nr:DNA/RNA nuclease SfsA [Planctomycetota bacterium]HNR98619.1 DNA/RNA nuclease SfsA [Planctomycetota bacterium]HNU24999.1 DNA/RNA nuclease SfsA [Planctomycetota bacterium]HOE28517.1 DNA/RNA nuclease SfsA [Planctomycetota bacterium]HOE85724.1 DNA/RNA nuclease SfsA [Planctomycetota bacterium]